MLPPAWGVRTDNHPDNEGCFSIPKAIFITTVQTASTDEFD
jgi:peptide deformylase